MFYQNKNFKNREYSLMTYNVHGSMTLANLATIIEVYKPSIIFLQEVKLTTEQILSFGRRLDYKGAANIDDFNMSSPGTGIMWHSSIPVTQVIPLYPCRMQVAMLGVYPLVNIYVPAGNNRAIERRQFFTENLFGLLAGYEDILPIMGGDWNCVIENIDLQSERYFQDRKSRDLENIVRHFNYLDCFRYLHGRKREFTWDGRQGASASRLDRFYIPDTMATTLIDMAHYAGFSDHKLGILRLELKNVDRLPELLSFGPSYFKMNCSILEDVEFQNNFDKMWDEIVGEQGDFEDIAEWWEYAKAEIKIFLQNFSATLRRTKRDLKELLCFMLDKATAEKNWKEVAVVRGKLENMMYRDNMGFVIRSRFKENQEVEKASLYHLNREKKLAQGGNLEKLVIDGSLEIDRNKIENEVTGFFNQLFSGMHGRNGVITGGAFAPDNSHLNTFISDLAQLSLQSREALEKPVREEEVEEVIKSSSNNKSPGLDGICYELYKHTRAQLAPTLTKVFNCQLDRTSLIQSNKEGVTRLIPKTEGGVVPRVDQLRPVTLLCTDYKLLTMIISNRLMKVLHEVITSGQLCSVRGRNIHYGTHNLLSSIIYCEERLKYAKDLGYEEKDAGGGVIISYDLMKAYDRVYIPYLMKVMEAMGFSDKFLAWVRMLHEGANTRFILNYLSKPVPIKISIRQGDPAAMSFFIIFIEPLLVMIRKRTSGFSIMGVREEGEYSHSKVFNHGWRVRRMKQEDEDYVDDVNVVLEKPEEMLVVDEIFCQFESFSGAILNRSEKTKLMGIGQFQGRRVWPLDWIKVEKSLKIFGVNLFPTYSEILENNWATAVRKMQQCLNSWNTRILNSVFQRADVLKTFVLPKMYSLAECLPLPHTWAKEIEKQIYKFIKVGKMEMISLEVMCNPINKGGLGMVCIRSKADSLFLKQTLRMSLQPGTLHWKYMRFFTCRKLRIGKIMGPCCDFHFLHPYYSKMVELYEEGVVMEICQHCNHPEGAHYCGGAECKDRKMNTTAKEIYRAYTDSLPPPRVEYKPDYNNVTSAMWERVWERVASPMLDPMQRQVVWRLVHNILPTRERLNRIGLNDEDTRQVYSELCNRCNLRARDTVTHMFTECEQVREAWGWTRRRLLTMLPNDMADLSNLELINLFYPKERQENEMIWLLGNYLGMVYEEAFIKGRRLTVDYARGSIRHAWLESRGKRMPQIIYISDVTTDLQQNLVFDNG